MLYCQKCEAPNPDSASACVRCGTPVSPYDQTPPGARAVAASTTSPGLRLLLPIGRSPLAIVAGYLGIASLLLVPAPLALVFGWLALRDLRARPHLHGRGRAWFAIAMGAAGTIALAAALLSRASP
jgi:hypothetical protein